MIFDEFDAQEERHRKGVVSVDLSRFEAVMWLLDKIKKCNQE